MIFRSWLRENNMERSSAGRKPGQGGAGVLCRSEGLFVVPVRAPGAARAAAPPRCRSATIRLNVGRAVRKQSQNPLNNKKSDP